MHKVFFGLFATLTLATALPAHAQHSALQSRMGQEEFRAAGLEKLDATELARLESWVAQQLDAEADTAQRDADPRAPAPAPVAVDSTLAGTFTGLARGREYTLANGQVWRQTDAAVLPGINLESPPVQIRPARLGGWWMKVAHYNTRARVERVR